MVRSVQFWAGMVACAGAAVLLHAFAGVHAGTGLFAALSGAYVFWWQAVAEDV